MKNILMLSSEASPFAKTGGLGDVLGSLPDAISGDDFDVRVIMPKYGCIPYEYTCGMEFLFYLYVPLGWRNKYCGVFRLKKHNTTYYFLDNEYYFGDSSIYKWNDLERFSFFDKAALEVLKGIGFKPDIIHLHDWQTGAVPVLLDAYYKRDPFYQDIKCIFTIHNLKHQGIYPIDLVRDFLSLDEYYFTADKLEFHSLANLLKAGLVYSDHITTVSPTYAEEIKTPLGGENLHGILSARAGSLTGILNGIDYEEYNPETDKFLFENYNTDTFIEGKKKNKTELQKMLNLPVDGEKVMIGLVSRLVDQKGLSIIEDAFGGLLDLDIQFVILGTGDEKYENMFRHQAWCNPEKVSANIYFSNEMAHRIYGAADIFLMPSIFEPCGLSQLIAMRYGTVPLVREVGGLHDTVFSYNEFEGSGNGFSFSPPTAHDMLFTLRRAIGFFSNKYVWYELVKNVMSQNFSWKSSAEKYKKLYGGI